MGIYLSIQYNKNYGKYSYKYLSLHLRFHYLGRRRGREGRQTGVQEGEGGVGEGGRDEMDAGINRRRDRKEGWRDGMDGVRGMGWMEGWNGKKDVIERRGD